MKIIDYTAQQEAEALTQWVGRVFRNHMIYGMVIDCGGRYGWVDLATGQTHLPETIDGMTRVVASSEFVDATLTIGVQE